jgi:hypothetical protein
MALIAGNVWDVISWQVVSPKPPRTDPRPGIGRRQLQCFAEGVLAHTERRASILFLLPESEADGGLVNHRLRYVLPGRFVWTNQDAVQPRPPIDLFASWRTPPPPGVVVWRGCEGVLSR